MDAFASYITFLTFEGSDTGVRFQNFHQDTRSYEGRSYPFSGFGYSGATYDLQGANVEGVLLFPSNEMSQSFIAQAAEDRWLVEVKTVWLNPDTYAETSNRLTEVYAVVSWSNNLTELECRLSSPLNAQDAELPARVLSQRIVGSLPPKGSISLV